MSELKDRSQNTYSVPADVEKTIDYSLILNDNTYGILRIITRKGVKPIIPIKKKYMMMNQ